jgi:hypothetical protein
LKGKDEVGGGDRIAVGPAGVFPEVERPGEIIGGGFPAFGEGGHRFGGLGVVLGEALVERHDDVERLAAVADVRIEVIGLRHVSDVQCLGAVAGFDGGLAPEAGYDEEGKQKAEGGAEAKQRAHGREIFGQ